SRLWPRNCERPQAAEDRRKKKKRAERSGIPNRRPFSLESLLHSRPVSGGGDVSHSDFILSRFPHGASAKSKKVQDLLMGWWVSGPARPSRYARAASRFACLGADRPSLV